MTFDEARIHFEASGHWKREQVRAVFDEIERRAVDRHRTDRYPGESFSDLFKSATREVRAELGIESKL